MYEVKWKSVSRVWLFATPWTIQFMEFLSPEYWSRQPFPSPGDLPNPGIKPRCPTLQMDSLLAELPGKPMLCLCLCANIDSREATHLEVGWIPGRRHTLKFSDRPLLSKVEVLFTIPQTQTPPLAPNRAMFTFLLIQLIKKAECQNI